MLASAPGSLSLCDLPAANRRQVYHLQHRRHRAGRGRTGQLGPAVSLHRMPMHGPWCLRVSVVSFVAGSRLGPNRGLRLLEPLVCRGCDRLRSPPGPAAGMDGDEQVYLQIWCPSPECPWSRCAGAFTLWFGMVTPEMGIGYVKLRWELHQHLVQETNHGDPACRGPPRGSGSAWRWCARHPSTGRRFRCTAGKLSG